MRPEAKTYRECKALFADEFLNGTMTPQEHRIRLKSYCDNCNVRDECHDLKNNPFLALFLKHLTVDDMMNDQ